MPGAAGKSVVIADDQVQPIQVALMPGAEFHAVWGSDAYQQPPSDGTRPDARTWFPPADGFRFGYVTLPPDAALSPGGMPPDSVLDEFRQKLPGMLEVLEPDSLGMHTSDTIDFVHIVSGEIWLEVDDGVKRQLRAGDLRDSERYPTRVAERIDGAVRHGGCLDRCTTRSAQAFLQQSRRRAVGAQRRKDLSGLLTTRATSPRKVG